MSEARGLKVGEVVTGRIYALAEYGIHVRLGPMDGLVHISDIEGDPLSSWASRHAIGDDIRVRVLHLDEQARRVALALTE